MTIERNNIVAKLLAGDTDGLLELVIDSGGRPKYPEASDALRWAVMEGNAQAVAALLTAEVDPNRYCGEEGNPLVRACYLGDKNVVDALLAGGAAINACDSDGQTPLMAAAKGCHTNIVQDLINKGADVKARDAHRRTALQWALTENDCPDVCALLVQNGCDPTSESAGGVSALDYAHQLNRVRAIKAMTGP